TRWYIGSSDIKEIVGGVTTEYNFIGGDAYTAPVVAVIQSGSVTYYYLLRDYLGNITHVYNASTSTAQEYSFDAWGRRRNPVTWSYDLTGQPELFADRGFTSHEYLKYFNLYNMNGRMYDPLVGRFLNVDPYVQMPDYTQNFNRYSYALNNPLKFTDPDGEWLWIPLMIIGAYIGGTSANDGELNPGKWENDFDTWAGVFLGGAVGAMGGYGIMNPGTVELVAGLGNSYVYGGLTIGSATTATGMGTDWDFNLNWTTAAGGGGNYNLSGRNTSPEQIGERAVAEARAKANGDNWAVSAAASYLAVLQIDVITPDPSDAFWPKWAGHAVLGTASTLVLYSAGKDFAYYMSKGGRGNIWPDSYPKPNSSNINWSLSDSQLATGVTGGGVPGGPGSDWNKIKKWFRDTRRKINGNYK
ncbi:MAG: RHS repeat-associated core domain-containing protein, partial [Ignavibacteria bacterium]|nr:RHS repeat-associated core domain-containing protein [Ignavibacteria bacterium]